MEKFSLIIPIMGEHNFENPMQRPVEYLYTNKSYYMNCIFSISNIDLSNFTDIYIVISEIDDTKFFLKDTLMTQITKIGIDKSKIHIISYNCKTSSQAHTVSNVISDYNITGPIFIKDVDNSCICKVIKPGNYILAHSLENVSIVDPQHKSYIMVDENMYITNIIEKRIVSDLFTSGGYSFNDAKDFTDTYSILKKYEDTSRTNQHIYISNIIYYLIMVKKEIFKPIIVDNYIDFSL